VLWILQDVRQVKDHLGNLALLNRRQNSVAKNWEFDKKKEGYFQEKTGGSPFQITSRMLKETEWTPAVLARHQTETVAKLKEVWDLHELNADQLGNSAFFWKLSER
jgi:hypothetical protein